MIESGAILVNKFVPVGSSDTSAAAGGVPGAPVEMKSVPLMYKGAAPCTVNKVLITSSESDKFVIKVCTLGR